MASDLHRDSLILCARIARSEEGKAVIRSDEFARVRDRPSTLPG